MTVMVAAGCAKVQTMPFGQSEKEIIFDAPVISRATKAATEVADEFSTDQSFNVYAHYYENMFTNFSEGKLYMDNVEVAYSEVLEGWDSKEAGGVNYYWPAQGTLTFAAYAPNTGVGTVSYGESGFVFKDFKVADEPEDQIDLLFSERAYNKTVADQLADNPFYSGVQLNFMHALSSIMFKVKVDDMLVGDGTNNYEFLIRKIEVLGALNQGTFKQNIPTSGNNPTTPMASESDWVDYSATTKDYIAFEGSLTVNSKTAVSTAGNEANKSNLILLPQQLYRDQDSKVQVRVSYDYRHSGMAAGSYISGSASTIDIITSDVATWLRGKRYVYTLTLGLYEITFTPKVEAWTLTPDVNLPSIQ